MTITTILLSGAAVLALGVGATFLAPREVEVRRSIIVDAAPAEVLALASSTEGYQQFSPYQTEYADLQVVPFGPASGVGSGFAFEAGGTKGTQTVTEVTADHVRYAIDLGPQGKPVQTIAVRAVPGGTEVIWTMEADMGMNPVGRVIGLFLDRMMGKTFEQGLANLAAINA